MQVGSAFIICIVGYSMVVSVVVIGTLASRECAIQVAHQLQHNSISSFTMQQNQTNSSNYCSLATQNCEIISNSAWIKGEYALKMRYLEVFFVT